MVFKYPSIDLVKTGDNITKLMKEKKAYEQNLLFSIGYEF